ncbi:long-chain fatty acid transporter [Salinivibrio kushneri]|uniref:outer membrane protein transport protein n=1 Tax=Salinivibrio TaxID=51366 RepID=UPI00061465F5|nr:MULTISPECIES: outer membrane protein transport protein [Salinivibrio]KKA44026.1 long-chain fatty acid outer membrane transporter [Salinivibrio sp. KP-1]OOE35034.1 long-chain fatty acid transporter [Salinivibrio kushneri]OOE79891.1 long-chain fatty acid transporter [Salinivibrio sp. ML198]
MSSLFKKSLVATSLSLLAVQAHSAGFQVSETSVSGLGRAFAGEAAIADNAAVGARNAAALTRFNTTAFSGGLTIIDPDVHADVESASNGSTSKATLEAGGFATDENDLAPTEYVPNFHLIQPLDDRLVVGFSAFSNFGLSTEYSKDFAAGPGAGDTALVTMNFNPNIAYEINDQWSIGAGVSAIYADAELNRFAGASASTLNSALSAYGTSFTKTSRISHLKGDGWGFGWNIGTLWEIDENNRLGLSYRSQTDITLEGDYEGVSTLGTGTVGQIDKVGGELDLNLPEVIEFSGFHQLNQQIAVHYSAMYVGWDSFQELKATSEQCNDQINSVDNQCLQKDENWDNSWRYALGATYTMDDHWAFRAGYAYDESPVDAEDRTLSIPDSDRHWWSLGTTYTANENLSVDAGFAYLDGDQVDGTEDGFAFSAGGDAYIYGLQLNYLF